MASHSSGANSLFIVDNIDTMKTSPHETSSPSRNLPSLPAFAFSLIFFERLEALVDNPRLHRLLDGVAAAAVGIIAATLVQLAVAIWPRIAEPLPAFAIAATALAAAFRVKRAWAAPAIVAGGALAGWLLLL